MIFLTFIKGTGEIVAPIIQSKTEQNFDIVFGANAELFKAVYDSLNISCNTEEQELLIYKDIKNYYVDVHTRKLVRKTIEDVSINYEEPVVDNPIVEPGTTDNTKGSATENLVEGEVNIDEH